MLGSQPPLSPLGLGAFPEVSVYTGGCPCCVSAWEKLMGGCRSPALEPSPCNSRRQLTHLGANSYLKSKNDKNPYFLGWIGRREKLILAYDIASINATYSHYCE